MAGNNIVLQEKTKELGLPEISVVDYSTDRYSIINDPEAEQCPYCATKKGFQINEKGHRKLQDVLILPGAKNARIVWLDYNPKRFLCVRSECGKTFYKPVTFVEKNRRYTCRLEIYIFRRCLKESADKIEASIKGALSHTTIIEIFRNVTKRIDREAPNVWKEPRVMSIHFMRIKTRKALLVTNIDEECVIDYLGDCSLTSIKKLAERFRNPDKIEEIWVDIYDPLIDAVKKVFPDATLRIGKFQIKRYIERIMLKAAREPGVVGKKPQERTLLKEKSELPKKTREKLKEFLDNNDNIRILYDLKEKIRTASLQQIMHTVFCLEDAKRLYPLINYNLRDIRDYQCTILDSFGEVMRNMKGQRVLDIFFSDAQTDIDELLTVTCQTKCNSEGAQVPTNHGGNGN